MVVVKNIIKSEKINTTISEKNRSKKNQLRKFVSYTSILCELIKYFREFNTELFTSI